MVSRVSRNTLDPMGMQLGSVVGARAHPFRVKELTTHGSAFRTHGLQLSGHFHAGSDHLSQGLVGQIRHDHKTLKALHRHHRKGPIPVRDKIQVLSMAYVRWRSPARRPFTAIWSQPGTRLDVAARDVDQVFWKGYLQISR